MINRNTRTGLLNEALSELRMKMVMDSLTKFDMNKSKAAEFLGIKRTTLLEILRSHGRADLLGHRYEGGKKYERLSDGRFCEISSSPLQQSIQE